MKMSESVSNRITVAEYLAIRLQQRGLDKLFGVPGNHLGPFISIMEEKTDIRWHGGTNEMNIGYAADGYARFKGISAIGVTYGVGALSLINTVSGAFVEQVPIVVINASPTYEQLLNFRHVGLLTSHMSLNEQSNINAYREVTIDAQKITNSALAPQQIDNAISACISLKQPVYLEICENIFSEYCDPPKELLMRRIAPGNDVQTAKAVDATVAMIEELQEPIFWVGNEVSRLKLQDEFIALVEETGIVFCSTIMGKTAVSEDHPCFVGIYNGKASDPDVSSVFKEQAKCRIGIGAWSTSKNLGGTQVTGEDWAMAAREGINVGHQYFPNVMLRDFITQLKKKLQTATFNKLELSSGLVAQTTKDDPDSNTLTYDNLFVTVNNYLQEENRYNNHFVVADAGFSLLGAQTLHLPRRSTFYSQASWLSIGYSVGAAVGLQLARQDDEQCLVFVGDGSFQETCQAVSDLTRTRTRNIVFVLNNEDFYGIEQMLVDARFYKGCKVADVYNHIHPWQIEKLADVFHTITTPCHGRSISTIGELKQLLIDREANGSGIDTGTLLVRVKLAQTDYPKAIQYKVDEAICS
jgi:TPP-dependent 2-oxoacid decarboxylase